MLLVVLLLGGEPGTHHLSRMAVAIRETCTLLHHVTPPTLMVGQLGCIGEWIHSDINTPHHAPKLSCSYGGHDGVQQKTAR